MTPDHTRPTPTSSAAPAPAAPVNPAAYVRALAAAELEREADERAALAQRRRAARSARRRTRAPGPSQVYSLRLGHDELAGLERRAALLGLQPSVLARNLIRLGLDGPRA